jgi:hypothetical protein
MQMSKYASKSFIKPEDLVDGPQRKTILSVEEGKFEKPVLTFHDGTRLSLNGTNVSKLIGELGGESDDWIGHEVELRVATLRYNGQDNPAVLVRVLNQVPAAAQAKPQPVRSDMDDVIPF